MSHRIAWVLLVVAACTAAVCPGPASAAREVPEVRTRRVCVVGVRVDLVEDPKIPGETRPHEVDDPCGPQTVPLGIPGGMGSRAVPLLRMTPMTLISS